MKGLRRLWQGFFKAVFMYPLLGLSAVFLTGILFLGAFNWSLEITNTEEFCMEYKKSNHYANRTGVRARGNGWGG